MGEQGAQESGPLPHLVLPLLSWVSLEPLRRVSDGSMAPAPLFRMPNCPAQKRSSGATSSMISDAQLAQLTAKECWLHHPEPVVRSPGLPRWGSSGAQLALMDEEGSEQASLKQFRF